MMAKKHWLRIWQKAKQNRKAVFWTCIMVLFLAEVVFFLWYDGKLGGLGSYFSPSTPVVPGMILFESKECDHCKKVAVFIENNKVEQAMPITRLDVVQDPRNANLLADKAQICGLPESHIGIPFFWDGQRCIVGDVDILQYLREQLAKK